MTKFIPGLELSNFFFTEAIQPLLAHAFPHLRYSAARLEWGSDVLGFDTAISMDHGWGPKMTLFLTEKDFSANHESLNDYFANHLPFNIRGFPTNFCEPFADGGVMKNENKRPIHHMITLTTPRRFFLDYLGADIDQPLTPEIWLTIPQQRLSTLKSGRIYHDGLEALSARKQDFDWYPHDLWLYIMANQWRRIDQEEPFIGRTGSIDDELGSRLIAGRLIKDLMHLGFLMEKQFAPYNKWFGTAFNQLEIAKDITPVLILILDSQNWKDRETHLSRAYLQIAEAHNRLALTPHITPEVSNFYDRPYLVPHSARFVDALLGQIQDPEIKALPPHLGSVDQVVNNTDVLDSISRCKKLKGLYFDAGDQ